jgi:RHS repeat-associated protein
VGNRLTENGSASSGAFSSTYAYDVNDRLESVTGTKAATYAYDGAGNVLKKTEPDSFGVPQVTEYTWDAENRLIAALPKIIQGQGNTVPQPKPINYLYDADGQLVREIREVTVGTQPPPANVTMYLADKNLPFSQILEERDGSGSLKAAYQFADGQLVKQVRGTTASFYHANHLSVGLLTDATGAVQNFYQYSPFGETVLARGAGAGSSSPSVANDHQFAGERFNADLGLYYLRARYLDPRLGRFSSIDPHMGDMARPITLNDYSYAFGNPPNVRDPGGRFGLMDTMTAVGIFATSYSATTNILQGDIGGAAIDVSLGVLGVGVIRIGGSAAQIGSQWWQRNRQVRKIYHGLIESMETQLATLQAAGKSWEQIARQFVYMRNSARIESRAHMTAKDVKLAEMKSMRDHKHPLGPTPEQQLAKYGSWEAVVAASQRSNWLVDAFFFIW